MQSSNAIDLAPATIDRLVELKMANRSGVTVSGPRFRTRLVLLGMGLGLALLDVDPRSGGTASLPVASPEESDAFGRLIAAHEYRVRPSGSRLQAPNRANDLRTYFDPDGARIHPRTGSRVSDPLAALRLASWGRPGRLVNAEDGAIHARGSRVELRRSGIVEWYENRPDGLEHGFVIEARPAGEGPLELRMSVSPARAVAAGDEVTLATPAGRTLHYAKLVAMDARGEELNARFAVNDPTGILLEVDDAGAAYPILIDPLLTGTGDATLGSDDAEALFGYSVASAGDVNGDGYDDVIVGAYDRDDPSAPAPLAGAAFLFHGGPGGILGADAGAAATRLVASVPGVRFGISVAGAGDVNGDGYDDVIVGSNLSDGETDEGAAYVFLGSANGIPHGGPETADATLQGNQPGGAFGYSVAAAGDVNGDGFGDVVIGAPQYDARIADGGAVDAGAAFVFSGGPAGIATGGAETAVTRLSGLDPQSSFGFSVAAAGDVDGDGFDEVVVAARNFTSGELNEGAAFVFSGDAGGIAGATTSTAATVLQSDDPDGQLFDVRSAGDLNGDGFGDLVAGLPLYGPTDSGAAFVYLGSATGIPSGGPGVATILSSDQAGSLFGSRSAGAGDVNGDGYDDLVVGAPQYASGESSEGAVFVYLGGAGGIAAGLPSTAYRHLEANDANAQLGTSVASAGDVNGDGYSDVIGGAPYAGIDSGGGAFVWLGGGAGTATGSASVPVSKIESNQTGGRLGFRVASAGDVNGDGFGDVMVGAPGFDSGELNEGAVFIFHGSEGAITTGGPSQSNTILESNQVQAAWGTSLASAGDVNGDGFDDVVVGSPLRELAGQGRVGATYIFLGSASGVGSGNASSADSILESNQIADNFGSSVGSAGDVNGDGYGDVIIGASTHAAGQSLEGAAFVFHGSSSGISSGGLGGASARLESDQEFSLFGWSVGSAGDVDGDGFGDVIVGARSFDSGQVDEGAAFVFHGSAEGIGSRSAAMADAAIESDQANASFGDAVSRAGDIDGDGFGDVAVGAPRYSNGQNAEGAVFLYRGSPLGIVSGGPAAADATLELDEAGRQFGLSVATAGDVNGDGLADLIVGGSRQAIEDDIAWIFLGRSPWTAFTTLHPVHATVRLGLLLESTDGAVAGAGDVDADGFADVIVGANGYSDPSQMEEGAAIVLLGNRGRSGRLAKPRQQRSDGSGRSIPLWGSSLSPDGFTVSMRASHPSTRGRVKLEVEACPVVRPVPRPFGHASCRHRVSASWTDVATPSGIELVESIEGLESGVLYRWRARILSLPALHAGVVDPLPKRGPWRRVSAQSNEADVRVVPESSAWQGLALGIVGLGMGWTHRRSR